MGARNYIKLVLWRVGKVVVLWKRRNILRYRRNNIVMGFQKNAIYIGRKQYQVSIYISKPYLALMSIY